jgi:hypothetical protein
MNRNRKTHRIAIASGSDREVDQHRHRISIRRSLPSLCGWSLWENLSSRNDTLRESFKITDGITLFDEIRGALEVLSSLNRHKENQWRHWKKLLDSTVISDLS